MDEYLVLRLDAPLMSFGSPLVDNFGKTERFISLSALTGLLANALGYDHSQHQELQQLQDRIRYAVRCDRHGQDLRDFQTAFLGLDFLSKENAWTTWSVLDERKGGPDAQKGTHIRYRDYIADSVYTITLRLEPPELFPTLTDAMLALRKPARPLFFGRKPCLPAAPVLFGKEEGENPLDALKSVPPLDRQRRPQDTSEHLSAWWAPEDGGEAFGSWNDIKVADRRDWLNQVHSGQRVLRHGLISLKEVSHE